jgi:hypothetical protein
MDFSDEIILRLYNEGRKEGLKLVEIIARQHLKENPDLKEFVMGMGTYMFTNKDGDVDYKKNNPDLDKLISEWDSYYYLTGEPMRFALNSSIVTDW